MLMSPVEFFRTLPKKECPQCGQHMEEQAESYLMECDRCLASKDEQNTLSRSPNRGVFLLQIKEGIIPLQKAKA